MLLEGGKKHPHRPTQRCHLCSSSVSIPSSYCTYAKLGSPGQSSPKNTSREKEGCPHWPAGGIPAETLKRTASQIHTDQFSLAAATGQEQWSSPFGPYHFSNTLRGPPFLPHYTVHLAWANYGLGGVNDFYLSHSGCL